MVVMMVPETERMRSWRSTNAFSAPDLMYAKTAGVMS
jgi:hypothetical protein